MGAEAMAAVVQVAEKVAAEKDLAGTVEMGILGAAPGVAQAAMVPTVVAVLVVAALGAMARAVAVARVTVVGQVARLVTARVAAAREAEEWVVAMRAGEVE